MYALLLVRNILTYIKYIRAKWSNSHLFRQIRGVEALSNPAGWKSGSAFLIHLTQHVIRHLRAINAD